MKRNPGFYPTQAELQRLLSYDPETGIFTWREGTSRAGKRAGGIGGNGYYMIGIGYAVYNLHILAWIYVYGAQLPKDLTIDHANGDPLDNRLCNLRAATWGQNRANQKRRKDARYPKGVMSRGKDRYGYAARITVNKKKINLGIYATPEEAHAAYLAAAKRYYGEFARAE